MAKLSENISFEIIELETNNIIFLKVMSWIVYHALRK